MWARLTASSSCLSISTPSESFGCRSSWKEVDTCQTRSLNWRIRLRWDWATGLRQEQPHNMLPPWFISLLLPLSTFGQLWLTWRLGPRHPFQPQGPCPCCGAHGGGSTGRWFAPAVIQVSPANQSESLKGALAPEWGLGDWLRVALTPLLALRLAAETKNSPWRPWCSKRARCLLGICWPVETWMRWSNFLSQWWVWI